MGWNVIKISGHELDDSDYVAQFAQIIRATGDPVVIVHGGGKEISAFQARMGIEPRYVDGIRVTDADSLQLVEMALCGAVNKRLVRVLVNAGVDALGLSGVDRGLIRAEKMTLADHDMGYTGVVKSVNVGVITSFLEQGITPVIAPICLGSEHNYNVNADLVAGAIAGALGAERLVFLSNVEGVLLDGNVLARLSAAETEHMIGEGTIFGGMIPKVRTALQALQDGVKQAVITNLTGLGQHGGTVFSND
jgi:acetylglutamate kinase